jgi:Na+-driven multidrug efflux pump
MLMQMMSAGAMGGGISSAIARALGGGRRDDADALVLHALVISALTGLLFTMGALAGGPALYRALGGQGQSLDAALAYSNIVFGGAILLWVFNSLASALRGTGNMIVPAVVICVGAVILIPLSPCLIFGWGPFPRLSVAGGGTAIVLYYAVGAAVLALYLWSGRSIVHPNLRRLRLRWPLFCDILRVGAVAALVTVQNNLTVLCTTGLIGSFGPAAIAG